MVFAKSKIFTVSTAARFQEIVANTDRKVAGLIYRVDISDDRWREKCPAGPEGAVRTLQGVQDVTVNMVFDPPWDLGRMSDEAKIVLDMS